MGVDLAKVDLVCAILLVEAANLPRSRAAPNITLVSRV